MHDRQAQVVVAIDLSKICLRSRAIDIVVVSESGRNRKSLHLTYISC